MILESNNLNGFACRSCGENTDEFGVCHNCDIQHSNLGNPIASFGEKTVFSSLPREPSQEVDRILGGYDTVELGTLEYSINGVITPVKVMLEGIENDKVYISLGTTYYRFKLENGSITETFVRKKIKKNPYKFRYEKSDLSDLLRKFLQSKIPNILA